MLALLDARGIEAQIVRTERYRSLGKAASVAAERAYCREGGVVVAVGGDGTVNAAANAALACGLPLGIVPAGTYNFVARVNGVPGSADAALALILDGVPRETRIARLNGRGFLVNASIGLYARLLSERESFTRRFGRNRAVTTLAAVASALRRHRTLELLLRERGTERRTRATTLIVGNNALQLELVGVRDVPDRGSRDLSAVLLHPANRRTLLAMIVRGWRGEVHETRELESSLVERLVVDVPERRARRITVALDGELVRETLPLTFDIDERPLLMMRPPASGSGAP